MRRLAPLAAVALGLALASAAPAHAAPGSGFVRTDDGIRLAYDLYRPAGAAPRGGRPAVVVLHGLGGSKDSMAQVARVFAARGYVALAYSVRGRGTSGGDFTLASPRDVRDLREVVAWLRRQPGVSGKVGCFGISLGGGECRNATPDGIFDAVVPVASWTDLATALWPGDVARSGIVAAFAQTVAPRSPFVRSISTDAVRSLEMGAIRALAARRSVLPRLGRVTTPVSIFQGRVDYAFDIDQALTALGRLRGPRRLYVGDFGHPPSSFATDFPGYVLDRSLAWFDRFLRPIFVDKTTGPEANLSVFELVMCLPPATVPDGTPGRAAEGARLTFAQFDVNAFANPPAYGEYRWRTLWTPYAAGTSDLDTAATVEAQVGRALPTSVSLRVQKAKVHRKGKTRTLVALSGKLSRAFRGVPIVRVSLQSGKSKGTLTRLKTPVTNRKGDYVKKVYITRPTYFMTEVTTPLRNLGAVGCTPSFGPSVPCVSAFIGGQHVLSSIVKVTPFRA